MDTRTHYRHVIQKTLEQYATRPHGEIDRELLFDREHDRYAVIKHGWQGHRHIHDCIIHIDIIGEKVWVQEDGTEEGITYALLEAGIPKHHIVIGFHPPSERTLTEFAVG